MTSHKKKGATSDVACVEMQLSAAVKDWDSACITAGQPCRMKVQCSPVKVFFSLSNLFLVQVVPW